MSNFEQKQEEFKQCFIELMKGAVPERTDDILKHWEHYNPKMVIKNGNKLTLEATRDEIRVDLKIIDVFWLIGFSGWKAIETYIPSVMTASLFNNRILDELKNDEELDVVERTYKERIKAAEQFIEGNSSIEDIWPPDIPKITSHDDGIDDVEYKAAYDLTVSALGFALFHEFRHVMLDQDRERHNVRAEEEMACDVWAREFITAKIATYASSKSLDYQTVLQRRSMSFVLAVLILHEITPVWDRGGNCDYFSVAERIKSIIFNTQLEDNSHFWNFAAAVLIGICRMKHISFNPEPMCAKELTMFLVELV